MVKVKRMLELLAGEAGFLLDNKVQEALQRMSPQDASMAQAESLLLALGVTDEAQLQALVNYFLKEVGRKRDRDKAGACFPSCHLPLLSSPLLSFRAQVPAPFQQEGEEGGLSSPTSPHDEEDEDEEVRRPVRRRCPYSLGHGMHDDVCMYGWMGLFSVR